MILLFAFKRTCSNLAAFLARCSIDCTVYLMQLMALHFPSIGRAGRIAGIQKPAAEHCRTIVGTLLKSVQIEWVGRNIGRHRMVKQTRWRDPVQVECPNGIRAIESPGEGLSADVESDNLAADH